MKFPPFNFHIPSQVTFLKMMSLFPRWDMLVPYRVISCNSKAAWSNVYRNSRLVEQTKNTIKFSNSELLLFWDPFPGLPCADWVSQLHSSIPLVIKVTLVHRKSTELGYKIEFLAKPVAKLEGCIYIILVPGVILLPTQAIQYNKGHPSKWPDILALFPVHPVSTIA